MGGRVATIYLAQALPPGSSGQPGEGLRRRGRRSPLTRRPADRVSRIPLLGLAPDGVCPAAGVSTGAVSSYLTISPLSQFSSGRCIFCGTFRRVAPPRC